MAKCYGRRTEVDRFPFVHSGPRILKKRIQMKKNRREIAQELGVSVKTLLGWETNRYQPCASLRKRLESFLGFDPALNNPTPA